MKKINHDTPIPEGTLSVIKKGRSTTACSSGPKVGARSVSDASFGAPLSCPRDIEGVEPRGAALASFNPRMMNQTGSAPSYCAKSARLGFGLTVCALRRLDL